MSTEGKTEFEVAPGLWNTCVKDKGQIVGVELRGFYDGVAYWQCQSCLQVWDRTGRPHTSTRTVPHPTNRLFTVGDFADKDLKP
jgi:hypothetical protein